MDFHHHLRRTAGILIRRQELKATTRSEETIFTCDNFHQIAVNWFGGDRRFDTTTRALLVQCNPLQAFVAWCSRKDSNLRLPSYGRSAFGKIYSART